MRNLEKKVLVIRRGWGVLFILMGKGDHGRCIFSLTSLQIGYVFFFLSFSSFSIHG